MTLAEIMYCLVLAAALGTAGMNEYYTYKVKVPPAPTLPHVRKAMLAFLEKYTDTNKPWNIADLGSGWGGLAIATHRLFRQSSIHGYELSPVPLVISKMRSVSRPNVHFKRKDILSVNLSTFDIIISYLSPVIMKEMKKKFETECKSGTLIVCNAFEIPGWTPLEQCTVGRLPKIPVFIYRL